MIGPPSLIEAIALGRDKEACNKVGAYKHRPTHRGARKHVVQDPQGDGALMPVWHLALRDRYASFDVENLIGRSYFTFWSSVLF
jgi:hypothetical protein